MIATLLGTLLVESCIAAGYALWRKKPWTHILLSSIVLNILTQSLLWTALILFSDHYLITLLVAEISILLIEAGLFHFYRYNRLTLKEAFLLSLAANLTSFTLGWFLPV